MRSICFSCVWCLPIISFPLVLQEEIGFMSGEKDTCRLSLAAADAPQPFDLSQNLFHFVSYRKCLQMWQPNALEKCQSQRIHRQTSKNRTWFRWSQIPHLFKWMTEQLHGCGLWVLQAHWRKKKRIKRMEKTKTKLTCVFCYPISVGRDLEHMWHFIYFQISQIEIELTDDWREREKKFRLRNELSRTTEIYTNGNELEIDAQRNLKLLIITINISALMNG